MGNAIYPTVSLSMFALSAGVRTEILTAGVQPPMTHPPSLAITSHIGRSGPRQSVMLDIALYIDTPLPFGLQSAPKFFSALADGLIWMMSTKLPG